jgi:hypothetical protein
VLLCHAQAASPRSKHRIGPPRPRRRDRPAPAAGVSPTQMLVSPTVESLSASQTCLLRRTFDRGVAASELHAVVRRGTFADIAETPRAGRAGGAQRRTWTSRSAAPDRTAGTTGPAAGNAHTTVGERSRPHPSRAEVRRFLDGDVDTGDARMWCRSFSAALASKARAGTRALRVSRHGDRYPARPSAIKLSANRAGEGFRARAATFTGFPRFPMLVDTSAASSVSPPGTCMWRARAVPSWVVRFASGRREGRSPAEFADEIQPRRGVSRLAIRVNRPSRGR